MHPPPSDLLVPGANASCISAFSFPVSSVFDLQTGEWPQSPRRGLLRPEDPGFETVTVAGHRNTKKKPPAHFALSCALGCLSWVSILSMHLANR